MYIYGNGNGNGNGPVEPDGPMQGSGVCERRGKAQKNTQNRQSLLKRNSAATFD